MSSSLLRSAIVLGSLALVSPFAIDMYLPAMPAIAEDLTPRTQAKLVIRRSDGRVDEVDLLVRIDTPIEAAYFRHGGILPYVLRQLLR